MLTSFSPRFERRPAQSLGALFVQGAAVAIDSAVPRREDTGPMAPVGDVSYPGLAAAMNIIDLVSTGLPCTMLMQTCRHISAQPHI